MSKAAKGYGLKVHEKPIAKRFSESEIMARQGAGVFLGGKSKSFTGLMKKRK